MIITEQVTWRRIQPVITYSGGTAMSWNGGVQGKKISTDAQDFSLTRNPRLWPLDGYCRSLKMQPIQSELGNISFYFTPRCWLNREVPKKTLEFGLWINAWAKKYLKIKAGGLLLWEGPNKLVSFIATLLWHHLLCWDVAVSSCAPSTRETEAGVEPKPAWAP